MAEHYYLVAQLPMLFFGRDPGITTSTFLDEAAKWMAPSDLRRLEGVRLAPSEAREPLTRLGREYLAFERRFAGDLAAWRKAAMDGRETKPSFPLSLVREGNPLEIEKKLLLVRWNTIEELSVGHHFDMDFLSAYFLQLQVLHRLSLFDKEKGMRVFQTLSRKAE
jgi:hypothetical protein